MPDTVIAVIDDDELVRKSTSSLLRSVGYATQVYPSARAFLDSEHQQVACILTDLQMPGLSGLDLRAELRRRGSSVPMILMTAFATPGVQAQAAVLEMGCVLEKPINCDRLIGAVEAALA
ncbi:response regulator transcription factor [Sphingomonas sp. OTU376]|uniref:response regulator transcription factor n=1 Tax=Sphingomonas sp. OTU376 TaxID=3043863 RepID=UPI00313E8746